MPYIGWIESRWKPDLISNRILFSRDCSGKGLCIVFVEVTNPGEVVLAEW